MYMHDEEKGISYVITADAHRVIVETTKISSSDQGAKKLTEIEEFDPVGLTFKLTEPRELERGDEFLIYGPCALPWLIHHNIIDNCTVPMDLGTFSGERAALDKNIY